MRALAFLALAALVGLVGTGCGSESECEHGVCSYPDHDQTWCARADKQCYYEDSPYYEP